MKGYANWNYRPYFPLISREEDAGKPYICRLAPGTTSIAVEWLGAPSGARLFYALREDGAWQVLDAPAEEGENSNSFVIEGLTENTDYRFYVETPAGKSNIRLARTGYVPGTVVNYLHPEDDAYAFSGNYLCSPSIVRLPNGKLITSMDVFRSKFPQNLTILCESTDGGRSWRYLTELFPCFWGRLFWHRDALYMLATSTEYGDLLIGRSDDEGKTWSAPTVILRGSCSTQENGFHKAPMPVIAASGRLWSAVEYGSWPKLMYKNSFVSIAEDADLLQTENWELTPPLAHNPDWPGAQEIRGGAIEGNAVVAPDGTLVNMLRYFSGRSLQLTGDCAHPDLPLRFLRVIDFPMAHTKFEVQRCGDCFVAVGNRGTARNILSVYASEDLVDWRFVQDIVNYEGMDTKEVGFQYPAFTFDGENLLVLSRTAFNHAHNFHDSNYQTFHVVPLPERVNPNL